jgi:hypothetical protein
VNLFGADVSALDVGAFFASARAVYALLALAGLLAMAALPPLRRPGWLLALVLAANGWAWLATTWPLQRLYAFGPSSDRVNNVAMCQGVAAGGSPLSTPQVGHVHFEPFWGLLVASLSGFDPERLLRVYGFLPVVMACAFAASLFYGLRPLAGGSDGWSGWERALVAGAATLLSSAPLDHALTYRVPWAMTFLLKPNHAAALVLLPWVVRAFAGIRGWRSRLGAGLLLHLMGWAFVVHMAAACAGIALLALLSLAARRSDARRDVLDAAAVIGVNLLVVSPYLVLLIATHGAFLANPRHQIPAWSAHLLEATARLGFLLPLAAWGAVVAWRRDRLGRAWAAQAAAALALWLAFYALGAIDQAKERDDVYYFLRVVAAAMAAIGAWDLARRAGFLATGAARRFAAAPARVAAALGVIALPLTVPYWWDPARMDLYFPGSLAPLPASVTAPAAVLARTPGAVVAGDPGAARWMAALNGTRVLFAKDFPAADWSFRTALGERLLRGDPAARPDAARFGVTHVIGTSAQLRRLGLTLEDIARRPDLAAAAVVHDPDGSFVALYELRPLPGARDSG